MTRKPSSSNAGTEAEIIANIERGRADVAAGRTVSHDEAMATVRAAIEAAPEQSKSIANDPQEREILEWIGAASDTEGWK